MIKLKELLLEGKQETLVQKFADSYFKKNGVKPIPIKFSNKSGKGNAYYLTKKVKGGKFNFPVSITVLEWDAVKDHPDEWVRFVAHEMAHHEINVKENSLRHTKKHDTLTRKIEKEMSKVFEKRDFGKKDTAEIKRLQDKIKYWKKNKQKLEKDYKDAGMPINYDAELKKMKEKLAKIK